MSSFWDENEYQPWTAHWIAKEAILCLAERRLPKNLLIRKKVAPRWYARLQHHLRQPGKIKVGFGPVVEGEYNIGVRGSRIDPIVNSLNTKGSPYAAGIFFEYDEMAQFDVIVIVKEFYPGIYPLIERLKIQGKRFFYDIVDNPFCTDQRSVSYREHPEFLRLMDGVISSSPIQTEDVRPINPNVVLIEHPIINFVRSAYPAKPTVDILWQGYLSNVEAMFRLHTILERVRRESGREVRMIYHSNCPTRTDGMFQYVRWKIRDWQNMLAQADIGIVIKPPESEIQRRKPSNKVLSYMAAGLPVVCTPTAADKLMMEHGKHGFFADTDDEWYAALKTLIEQPELRKTMGVAGRDFVWQHFTIQQIADKYIQLFNTVDQKKM
jgi:glycosyltransferase involved in cell wall biosynthesis